MLVITENNIKYSLFVNFFSCMLFYTLNDEGDTH